MKIAEVRVSGCRCETVRLEPIPRGIVGAVVSVEYTDPAWDSLRKTVVFRGVATKDVLDAGSEIVIPAEVVSKAGGSLYMGVYGVDAENSVVIPTIWTELGVIQGAATPSSDASTTPSLPVWAQLQAMVGDLGALDTEAKSNLVAAINEALTKGGGELSPAEVQKIVDDYLKANPPGAGSDGKDGITPTIGKNGNWFLGSTDTGKPSRGADGTPGAAGAPGADGKDGITPTIGENGNWYLGSTDTGKPSRGADGTPGLAGAPGKDGAPGASGKDGTTPTIGENGNWYLGNTDTGKPSRGEDGAVPDIQIGTVTTLPAGSDATASMGGTAENPLLNLGIPKGADGRSGGSGGTDISLGLTSATVGQTVRIKAVDADGKPTAWEAADLPAGAGETWQFITEITLDDAVNVVTINKDANGNSFALKRVMIDCVITLNTDDPFTNIKTRLNGHVCSDNATPVMNNSNVRYYSFYAEIIPGSGALCWQACSGANYNWGGDLLKMGYKYNNLWQSDAITSLSIHPNDGNKNIGLAGTKIHVLGVRA